MVLPCNLHPLILNPYLAYRGKGQFGPDKITLDIVVGEKDDFIYVRFISDKLNLNEIESKNIRLASADRSQSAFFVKLFDAVCRDLMLSPRDDFGIQETNTNVVKKPSAVDDRMNNVRKKVGGPLSRENSKKQLDSFSSLANGSRIGSKFARIRIYLKSHDNLLYLAIKQCGNLQINSSKL